MRFSYAASHPLDPDFEQQLLKLIREYAGDALFLGLYHPAEPHANEDATHATALALMAGRRWHLRYTSAAKRSS